MATTYRGRFAPSPTGPLHFGSLVAALASYLDARAHRGTWFLRIEDLDTPRVRDGASAGILTILQRYGLHWDGEVIWQSTRAGHYQAALERLCRQALCYPCACSRKEIADSTLDPDRRNVYPGTCRNGLPGGRSARAWRLRVPDDPERVCFIDRFAGVYGQSLSCEVGDFVVARTDATWTYQLAVVVDDYLQGITHIVRGADLLDSTPRQIFLQACLHYPHPVYAHVPVVVTDTGVKLSKQTGATALDPENPLPSLLAAMAFLGFSPPSLRSLSEFWNWAVRVWAQRYVA